MFSCLLEDLVNSVRVYLAVRFCLLQLICFPAGDVQARALPADSLYSSEHRAMGTTFRVYLYTEGAGRASELFQVASDEIDRVDAILSNYLPESELSRINRSAVRGAVRTDPEMFSWIQRSVEHSRNTGGAFDISVGALMEAWGFYRGEGEFPDEEALKEALESTGWQNITLDSAGKTIHFTAPGLRLDPGASGKGYAVDRAIGVLRGLGMNAAMIEAGRSAIFALGAPPGKNGWRVNLIHPTDTTVSIATVYLRDQGLSTSGDYEKYFEFEGRRYSHIIDPRTGYPAREMIQATVIARSAEEADVLSTAISVAGPADAEKLIGRYSGASAIFLYRNEFETIVRRINRPDRP